MPALYQIIVVALLAAFIISLLGKSGLREKMRNYFDDNTITIVADMLDCDFCISFWMSVIISSLCLFITNDYSFIIVPFCATPITRYLL